MNLEHPLDFSDQFWDPIRGLSHLHGDDWENHRFKLCWESEERPELCNHQLLNHLYLRDDLVPTDFKMAALTIMEVKQLLDDANAGQTTLQPASIKGARFDFLMPKDERECSKESVDQIYRQLRV
jgi:hypothetical protein